MKNAKFFALLLAGCFLFANTSQAQKRPSITGEGSIVKQEFSLGDYSSIGLGVNATVYISKGSQNKVTIEAQQNIIDNIKREIKNGSWNIEFDKRVKTHKDITIYITMSSVEGLAIGGSGDIIGKDAFENLKTLDLSIAGSGMIEFSGSADKVSINIAGSGDVKTSTLKAKRCEVSIAGSGDCQIDVSDDLDVSIAGSGDVHYKGRPRVNSSIAGSGSVRSSN